MLQLIKDLHDNSTSAIQADKDKQNSGFRTPQASSKVMCLHLCCSISSWTACTGIIESKMGELGLKLTNNIDGH